MTQELGSIVASSVFAHIVPALRRARRNAALYVLCALFALTAYVAAVIALGIWISEAYGALEAALTIAVAMIANRIDRRRAAASDRTRTTTVTLALSLLPVVVRSRLLMATAVAGGLAFAVSSLLSGEGDGADPAQE
ncbi:hypothetical protein [Breoghania sp.]|uniref:hypothetical protein n=1 Tax=Breoghania sp. TaxID=2065378 RepID=UPI00262110A4|nr:hypothetical protein [Breoghania sp.]MDJ0931049.1 hypothetical protein [Breoghania sp.]